LQQLLVFYFRLSGKTTRRTAGSSVWFSGVFEKKFSLVFTAKKGRVGKRIVRRGAGRLTGKGLGKLFK